MQALLADWLRMENVVVLIAPRPGLSLEKNLWKEPQKSMISSSTCFVTF
ncbi:hypothetical protein SAMN02745126_05300 [Enhydrobacter aerosaccus]|uniref:Uncharacterized protein n=1 Tax=Enhydrobacter aerosaccus TaxID=225324 RepID=A0A1T4SYI1_9HYPH|nr:hypothetical protein SAMN02745126_05300 [Enhydrobacter aerosaccus]